LEIFNAQLNCNKNGLTIDEENNLYENVERFAPVLRTRMVTDALADYFLKEGIKNFHETKAAWGHLSIGSLDNKRYIELVDFIESRLPNYFPIFDLKHIQTIKNLQKKYDLSPQEYNQIAEIINSNDPVMKKL